MTNEERISRGTRYEACKPVLDELFAGVRQHLLENIEAASPMRGEDILEMHRGLQNLAKLREAIKLVVNDGLIAAHAASQAQLTRG